MRNPRFLARACGAVIFLLVPACAPGPFVRRLLATEPAEVAGAEGSARCASCHHDEALLIRRSAHREGPAGGLGCLGCHKPHEGMDGASSPSPGTPAPAALAAPPAPAPLAPRGQEKTRERSHDRSHEHGHAAPLGPAGLRADCASCHPIVEAEFQLPFRHPLGRGGIECTSCHPPHGLPRHELREELTFGSCVGCHTEKKGPFVFHHPGNRNLQCISCHEPHGSANRRMLTHASDRMLCFSCHDFIEIFHLQSQGSIYRKCITCHTEIHGSNWNRDFLR